jgi:hypothetical protein
VWNPWRFPHPTRIPAQGGLSRVPRPLPSIQSEKSKKRGGAEKIVPELLDAVRAYLACRARHGQALPPGGAA